MPPNKKVLPFRRAPRAFPAHLPRETIVHAPASCNCPDCGGAMRQLGKDMSEMLDLVPGYFKVIRHVRPKLSCGHCSRVVQQPARPIERAMAAPGLLAQIIVANYADHCPLYRQQGIYRRSGVELDRVTLAAWVGGVSDLLEPLVEALGRYVRAAEKVHADDTPAPVLDPGAARPRLDAYGLTCAMIARQRAATHRRCGIAIHLTARAVIRKRTCVISAAFCRPTPIAASPVWGVKYQSGVIGQGKLEYRLRKINTHNRQSGGSIHGGLLLVDADTPHQMRPAGTMMPKDEESPSHHSTGRVPRRLPWFVSRT